MPTVEQIRAMWFNSVGVAAHDFVVVAGSASANTLAAGLGWPGARVVWQPGHDGADIALASAAFEALEVLSVAEVFVGSGDRHFCELAVRCREMGLPVTVVTGRGHLAAPLYKLASRHIALTPAAPADRPMRVVSASKLPPAHQCRPAWAA